MITQIKNKFHQFRRRCFPSSHSTTAKQHDALMTHLESIDHRLTEFNARLASHDEVFKGFSGLQFLLAIAPTQQSSLFGELKHSKSQIWQDIFVLSELKLKRGGFFVEFGATNGIDLSNTYILEKKYGWNGILAEPARCWHAALLSNRSSYIETKCVWSNSNTTINFSETDTPEFSTVSSCISSDLHQEVRKKSRNYNVETISLLDMLEKYNAPSIIDYMSIDTEGSEFEILNAFDFDRYKFKVISCEHNFTDARDSIHRLLVSKGYERKYEYLSQWDDWYVRP